MIHKLKDGCQVVIGECPWVPSIYLAVGNARGTQGAIVRAGRELDHLIDELVRIRNSINERELEKQAKRNAA